MTMMTIDVRFINASGIGTYIKELVPGVIRSLPQYEFALLGKPEEIASLKLPSDAKIKVISASSKMYSLKEQWEIPRLIPSKSRLYFSPHYPTPIGYRGKLVATVHDLFHLAMPDLVRGLHKKAYAKWMLNRLAHKADVIITVSEFSKAEFAKYIDSDVDKVHAIPLGVNKDWFNLSSLPNPHPRPYLLFIGNVKPNKNLSNLVLAYQKLLLKIPHDLVIIGKKDGFHSPDQTVYEIAKAYPDRIHFTGFVPEALLKSYMDHASVFIFPSIYEGFGLPPLEAMAAGIPTIVSHSASLPEVCGDASLYCDPYSVNDVAQKIEQLIVDPLLQNELHTKGLDRAKEFTWDKTIEKTALLLDEEAQN
ncbi:glycosyltransferase family 1 protein [Polynucleobacter sp. KF022]|uniref:glycosyltransferase family 4 protein n=1 Tax=Polynucleobacter sp. KF022 TaxID=2982615 RepID=UPI002377C528|nr:glycosyltransferase family 1 protein [Polynucleobacter sp. KF022]BDT74655.1 glycosyl transferase [Polynucleobacter sp. KF022]